MCFHNRSNELTMENLDSLHVTSMTAWRKDEPEYIYLFYFYPQIR